MASRASGLRFTLDIPGPTFGPRLGVLTLDRPSGHRITLPTPTLLTTTSRGVVPHLTRSHVRASPAIGLVHVPFESFLEQSPPIPTLQSGPNALHRLLGFDIDKHIVILGMRDPDDTREMPTNKDKEFAAYCLRGVRRITPEDWTSYTTACTPDLLISLSDTPHTPPPFSQKRLTKSITRSTAWLASLLSSPSSTPILLPLAGSTSPRARTAFSRSLSDSYDAHVAGYTVDLAHLRHSDDIPTLLHASLAPLPPTKPRLIHGLTSPHKTLRLIRDVGLDIIDARWAIDAASYGVALDFVFPVPSSPSSQQKKKKEIGHNLYHPSYRLDFTPLSTSPSCPCIACTPLSPPPESILTHCPASSPSPPNPSPSPNPPLTRAYLTHLLHTHEMSAHSLLVSHNLCVVSAFLEGVRGVLGGASGVGASVFGGGREGGEGAHRTFDEEIARFEETYLDFGEGGVLEEARAMWGDVERARGKGRLRREKEGEGGGEVGE